MAGCGCGSGGVASASQLGGTDDAAIATVRDMILAKVSALGPADQCPGTREYVVTPRTGAGELFTTRPAPVAGFAPDLVLTYETSEAALDAALRRLAQVGGKVSDRCP